MSVLTAEAAKEMLSVTKVGEQYQVRINNSSLSIIQDCPRKAYYALHRGLRGEGTSPALIFGTAIHAALEVFYGGAKSERVLPPNFLKEIEKMLGGPVQGEEDFLLYRATRKFLTVAEPLASLPSTDKRSLESGVWTLGHYFTTYIDDPYTVLIGDDGKPMTELFLEHCLYETPRLKIIFFGTVDVILENLANKQILFADHKTSSIVGNDFYNRLKPNHQYTGYVFLAQKCLQLMSDKFMVNCIQVKPKPKTSRGTAPHFPRQITSRSDMDMDEFKDAVVYYVNSYLACLESDVWPMGPVNSCAMYGGCQYLELCSAPKNLRDTMIEYKYSKS